jgi:predicted lipoprotein with Yx(FWY)xxD motif
MHEGSGLEGEYNMQSRASRLLRFAGIASFAALAAGAVPTLHASAQTPGMYGYPSYPVAASVLPYPYMSPSYPSGAAYAPSTTITVRLGSASSSYQQSGSYASSGSYGSAGYANGSVAVTQSAQLGPYLTAGGMTLYVLSKDQPGYSACFSACVSVWPPLQTPAGGTQVTTAVRGVIGSLTRRDAIQQVTYNGMPLYYFSHDAVPGDTNGQGVTDEFGHWMVARP